MGIDGVKDIYNRAFGDAWPVWLGGLLIGLFNVYEYIMEKPWGITTATSRWTGMILYKLGVNTPEWLYFKQKEMMEKLYFMYGGDAVNIGLLLGAFIAACLSYEFAIRTPRSKRMYLQEFAGGIIIGYSVRLTNGCNLGSFICSIPSLSLSGWIYWAGLAIGAYLGVQYVKRQIYRMPITIEKKTIERSKGMSRNAQMFLGIIGILAAIIITLFYIVYTKAGVVTLFLIGIAFGVILQRSRFCWATCYKDLFISRNAALFKAIIISMLVSTIGFSLIMYKMVPDPSTGKLPAHAKVNEIGRPFGIPHLIGGILFGFGIILVGGCASGIMYRIAEGYTSIWVAFLGVLVGHGIIAYQWGWLHPNILKGTKIWLPQYIGWGWSVFLTISVLVLIYLWISQWEVKDERWV